MKTIWIDGDSGEIKAGAFQLEPYQLKLLAIAGFSNEPVIKWTRKHPAWHRPGCIYWGDNIESLWRDCNSLYEFILPPVIVDYKVSLIKHRPPGENELFHRVRLVADKPEMVAKGIGLDFAEALCFALRELIEGADKTT